MDAIAREKPIAESVIERFVTDSSPVYRFDALIELRDECNRLIQQDREKHQRNIEAECDRLAQQLKDKRAKIANLSKAVGIRKPRTKKAQAVSK